MQEAVGENMPSLQIGCQLHLIDRGESQVGPARHCLHRADEVTGVARGDFLLAGDERDMRRSGAFRDARVDFRARSRSGRPISPVS